MSTTKTDVAYHIGTIVGAICMIVVGAALINNPLFQAKMIGIFTM